ncbi:hypothetical protein [Acidovorax sp. sic0104]|uniref:hypothetical protein n=1 Tax=Acidovorax sp. sic0104 TaxID=2854784 RepID=UPI001C44883E|nr:hypothetical protein [Acidovorax sp. sic0104]MBV7542031.1 hypothetical protein [Acidovorax sp. sic0104]
MGSTVSTAKLVAAFATSEGTTYYALYEESYEENVHPHTRRWNCVGFGDLPRVLKTIFGRAANCEPGMLWGADGPIAPTEYIAAWLHEMKSPMEMPDHTIDLQVSAELTAHVPKGMLGFVTADLERWGRHDVAQALRVGKPFPLSLHKEPQLFQQLFGGELLPAWRGMPSKPSTQQRPGLGYAPEAVSAATAAAAVPRYAKLPSDLMLERHGEGVWRIAGWRSRVVELAVEVLWNVELEAPGVYDKHLTALRIALRDAPTVAPGATVVVDLDVPLQSPHATERRLTLVTTLAERLGVRKTSRGYEFPYPCDDEDQMLVISMPPECVYWEIPDAHLSALKLAA